MKPTEKTDISTLTIAEARRELGHASRGKSRFTKEQIHSHLAAVSKCALETEALAEIQAEEDAEADKANEIRIANANVDNAARAMSALVHVGAEEDEAEQKLMDVRAKRQARVAEAVVLLERALGRPADGDVTFMFCDDALMNRLGFHGLPLRGFLGQRELPPGVENAVAQVVGNFKGQLRIHARKHGLEFKD